MAGIVADAKGQVRACPAMSVAMSMRYYAVVLASWHCRGRPDTPWVDDKGSWGGTLAGLYPLAYASGKVTMMAEAVGIVDGTGTGTGLDTQTVDTPVGCKARSVQAVH